MLTKAGAEFGNEGLVGRLGKSRVQMGPKATQQVRVIIVEGRLGGSKSSSNVDAETFWPELVDPGHWVALRMPGQPQSCLFKGLLGSDHRNSGWASNRQQVSAR
jgi:hypothetical protein